MSCFDVPPQARPFEEFAAQYDNWFDRNEPLYRAEIDAVSQLLGPVQTDSACPGLEVGVGSGRFAAQLGVTHGVEPSPRMAALARLRGIEVSEGVAEALPYKDESFGYTLFCTSLCFVADAERALSEAKRVTTAGGAILIGYLNLDSSEGRALKARQGNDRYFAAATLRTTADIKALLISAGYRLAGARQVVSTGSEHDVRPGADAGFFCVVRARLDRHESSEQTSSSAGV